MFSLQSSPQSHMAKDLHHNSQGTGQSSTFSQRKGRQTCSKLILFFCGLSVCISGVLFFWEYNKFGLTETFISGGKIEPKAFCAQSMISTLHFIFVRHSLSKLLAETSRGHLIQLSHYPSYLRGCGGFTWVGG